MFEQVKLSYAFNALEPHIDALTMETHYSKHHAAYTKNLNAAAEKAGIEGKKIEDVLSSWKKSAEPTTQAAVRNNGGGFYNHNLYFSTMAPGAGGEPTGELAGKINAHFGSFADFKEKISNAAVAQFGSGWGWLSTNAAGELEVSATPNQDNPLLVSEGVWTPILGIDVWEHAYYLKYKNLRADYVTAFFNVINWNEVAAIYARHAK